MRLINWLICADCLIKKTLEEFPKNSSIPPHYKHYYCKSCMRERSRKNRSKNPHYYKSYRAENKEKLAEYSKEYRRNNAKKINEYNRTIPLEKKLKHNELKKKKDKERRQTEEYKIKRQAYCSKKYREDVQFRLKKKFEAKLNYLLDKNDLIESVTLIGCTVPEYKHYLEERFTGDMSWDNYGTHWNIHRVVQFIEWDLTDAAQAALCFHYTNSTPMEVQTII